MLCTELPRGGTSRVYFYYVVYFTELQVCSHEVIHFSVPVPVHTELLQLEVAPVVPALGLLLFSPMLKIEPRALHDRQDDR